MTQADIEKQVKSMLDNKIEESRSDGQIQLFSFLH